MIEQERQKGEEEGEKLNKVTELKPKKEATTLIAYRES